MSNKNGLMGKEFVHILKGYEFNYVVIDVMTSSMDKYFYKHSPNSEVFHRHEDLFSG